MSQLAVPETYAWSGDIALEPPRFDRRLALSSGASLLLHGAALALLLIAWHTASKPDVARQPIPVTLVTAEEAEPGAPVESTPTPAMSPPAAALPSAKPLPKAAPRAPRAEPPAPARPPSRNAAIPALPGDDITALLGEGVSGRLLSGADRSGSRLALRSSVPVSEDYLILLQSRLARFQYYPEDAKAHHQEGKGIVGFTLARDGRVVKVWMDQSTGSQSLDSASLSMVEDASPVPPLPPPYAAADTIDFFMPINYLLSNYQRLFQ